jgi:hypothetical protein
MRPVVLYLVLIGLPVIGILAILRAGQSLVAPRAVSGTWRIEPARGDSPAAECLRSRMGSDRLSLTVSQSGPSLEAVLRGERQLGLRGSIRNDRVRLESEVPAPSGSADVTLQATLGRGDLPALTGVLDVGCGTMAVTATRVAEALTR